jgi:hypothetical protein
VHRCICMHVWLSRSRPAGISSGNLFWCPVWSELVRLHRLADSKSYPDRIYSFG